MNYTKGEWKRHELHIFNPNIGGIADVLTENLDDAKLVSAAPELYEALKAIVKADEKQYTVNEFLQAFYPLVQKAKEVLKKAEGG